MSHLWQDQCFLLSRFRLCQKESRETHCSQLSADAAELSHLWKPVFTHIQTSLTATRLILLQLPGSPAYIKPCCPSGREILPCCPSSNILLHLYCVQRTAPVLLVLVPLFLISPSCCATAFLLTRYKEEFSSPFALSQAVRGFISS